MSTAFSRAIQVLNNGGIIAYPTEAVYGLGCDPFNESAVKKLLTLKQRSPGKGLILIAADWQQLQPWVKTIPADRLQKILATWPGPYTWVFPAAETLPRWITGINTTVAIRVTAHPLASQLCAAFGKPLVSTSANKEKQTPARNEKTVRKIFGATIDDIISGELGNLAKPTEIRDALSGKVLRA